MIVIRQHRIYRQDLKANPTVLYIFGDNLERVGRSGQAFEMRGEPNAFGIATKRSIGHNYPDDYFFDWQDDVIGIIDREFESLSRCIARYDDDGNRWPQCKLVVIPLDGIGTGLSRLPETAPKALEYINKKLEELEKL